MLYVSTSRDGGRSFSSPVVVSDDRWHLVVSSDPTWGCNRISGAALSVGADDRAARPLVHGGRDRPARPLLGGVGRRRAHLLAAARVRQGTRVARHARPGEASGRRSDGGVDRRRPVPSPVDGGGTGRRRTRRRTFHGDRGQFSRGGRVGRLSLRRIRASGVALRHGRLGRAPRRGRGGSEGVAARQPARSAVYLGARGARPVSARASLPSAFWGWCEESFSSCSQPH